MYYRGFTLLETIVALVLIASTGMALLSWINTNLITLQRVQKLQQSQEAIRNALAFMDTINPLETPQGQQTIGIYNLQWQAQAVELPKDGMSTTGYISLFQLGLYDTKIEISLVGEKTPLTHITLRQVGFSQVRKLDLTDF